MFSEDLPAKLNTAALAGCSVGGTGHLCGSEGGLGHLQDVAVIVITEQLQHGGGKKEDQALDVGAVSTGCSHSYNQTE